jgi:hypothetical protein
VENDGTQHAGANSGNKVRQVLTLLVQVEVQVEVSTRLLDIPRPPDLVGVLSSFSMKVNP